MYYKRVNGDLSILTIVVDDILHTASSERVIRVFFSSMTSVHRIKNLDTPSLMVDINVSVTPTTIRLNQTHYMRQVTETFLQIEVAPTQSPWALSSRGWCAARHDDPPLPISCGLLVVDHHYSP